MPRFFVLTTGLAFAVFFGTMVPAFTSSAGIVSTFDASCTMNPLAGTQRCYECTINGAGDKACDWVERALLPTDKLAG